MIRPVLSDAQWQRIAPHLPGERVISLREGATRTPSMIAKIQVVPSRGKSFLRHQRISTHRHRYEKIDECFATMINQ